LSKKPSRAYLDSMVFIFGILEECNSRLTLFLAQLGEFEVVTSELVLEEVERFFKENFGRETGFLARKFVEAISTRIVARKEIQTEMKAYKQRIKDKDLENLAAVKHEELRHLVAYDNDYVNSNVKEYVTPKKFVQLFNIKPYDTEY